MKIKLKWYQLLLRLFVALVVVVAIGTLTFVIATVIGRNRLYGDQKNKTPDVSASTQAEVITREEGSSQGKDSGYVWQEGDIRYKDDIYRYNKEMLTFLFMGIDQTEQKEAKGQNTSRADSIFLLALNPHTNEATVIGIPRDTMAEVEMYDENGQKTATATIQLAMQYAYGDGGKRSCELTRDAVEKLFNGLPIHGYCSIQMDGIPALNDAVGGIELTALQDVPGAKIKEGDKVLLKGQAAYHYLHDRDTKEAKSAAKRLERQKQYLIAYISKVKKATKEDISTPVTLYNTLSKYIVTDVTVDEVSYLATQATNYTFDADHIISLEGEQVMGSVLEEFRVDEEALYELILQIFYEKVEA